MTEKHEQAEKDYMLGMKYKDIAAKYNVTINTVKSWKKRYGWQRALKKCAHKAVHKKRKACTQKNDAPIINNAPAVVKPAKEELTEKQQFFCYYFVNNHNATQAAIKAGYSPDTAGQIGYQLLQKTSVRNEINRLKELKRQSIMLDPDDIVERYMRIAFSDMTDVAEWGTEEIPMVDSHGAIIINPDGTVKTHKYNYLNFKDSNQVDGGLICEVSQGKNGIKVKREDSLKALAWLADYFNMNPMSRHKMAYDNAVLKLREREVKLKEF